MLQSMGSQRVGHMGAREQELIVGLITCCACVLSCSVVSDSATPWTAPGISSDRGDSLAKSTGVVSHALLQGIFPTQGLNPSLLHCTRILYCLSHRRSPRILEWVAFPSPGDLPNPGIEPGSLALQADSLPAEPPGQPRSHVTCVLSQFAQPWLKF